MRNCSIQSIKKMKKENLSGEGCSVQKNQQRLFSETNDRVMKYSFAELILLAIGVFYIVNYFTQII